MPPSKLDLAWLEHYQNLVDYKEKFGNCNVNSKDSVLGGWVRCQRKANNKQALRKDRKKMLDAIGFNWDPRQSVINSRSEAAWDVMYENMKAYHQEQGHCKLPSLRELQRKSNTEETKRLKKLLTWTNTQRGRRKVTDAGEKQTVSTEGRVKYRAITQKQIDLLDQLGFEWDPQGFDKIWDEKLAELEQFKAQHGDCLVPQKSNGKLGSWVAIQRLRRHGMYGRQKQLTDDQVQLLNELNFAWNNEERNQQLWDQMYRQLERYVVENGHCRVPTRYKGDANAPARLGKFFQSWRLIFGASCAAVERAIKICFHSH